MYVAAGPRPLHRSDLYRIDLERGSTRRLTELGQAESPVWCDGGSLLFSAYGTSREPFRQIWRLDAEARLPVQITRSRHDKSPLQCSTRPARITMRLTSGASAVEHVTDDELVEESLRWSADGRRLVFAARGRQRDLWTIEVPELPWLKVPVGARLSAVGRRRISRRRRRPCIPEATHHRP